MSRIAQITYTGGGAVFPMDDGYAGEILVDHVVHLARRQGSVTVTWGSQRWNVRPHGGSCPRCEQPRARVLCVTPSKPAGCARCAFVGHAVTRSPYRTSNGAREWVAA